MHGADAPGRLFPAWFGAIPAAALPNAQPATLFEPAIVSDRSDGKIAHLDGLNLSRAWCWRSIAPLLPSEEQRRSREAAADEHLAAALPHIAGRLYGRALARELRACWRLLCADRR